ERRAVIDIADKTKSPLVEGADQSLAVPAVAKRAPSGADTGADRRLRHDPALPDRVDQLVLADDPVAIADEENEQVENLRLEVHDRTRAPQLPPRKVDLELVETEVQSSPSR